MTGLQPYVQNATNGEENTSILEVANGKVYLGGSQHFLHQYRESDFTLERSHIARSPGGDFQAIAYNPTDGKLYAVVPLRPVPVPGLDHARPDATTAGSTRST